MKHFKNIDWTIYKVFGLIAMTFLALIMALYFTVNFCFLHYEISDNGMAPLIKQTKNAHSFIFHDGKIERGDLVLVEANDGSGYWVRRVIGLPNETITCIDEVIYINGEPLDEDYLDVDYVKKMKKKHSYFTKDFNQVELWTNEYFLLGDDRIATQESDSRALGTYLENSLLATSFIFPELGWVVIK